MAGMTDRYLRWFDYEKDSHAKTLASLHGVPEDLRSAPSFQKAIDLFAHIIAARYLWLFRLGILNEAPREVFPKEVALGSLGALAEHMHAVWADYLGGLDEVTVLQVIEYRSLEGDLFANSIEDILTQLFGHSWYHRGQIAQLIRSIGGEPAVTDLIFWTREPISDE